MPTTLAATIAWFSLALAACGGATPANDPSSAGTSISGTGGPANAGDPGGGSVSNSGTTAASGAPASPMEGSCKSAAAPLTVKDRAACTKGCLGLDDTVPPQSKCISQKQSCVNQCNAKFTTP